MKILRDAGARVQQVLSVLPDRSSEIVVPLQLKNLLQHYLLHRHNLMRQLEERDIEQLKKQSVP